MAFQTSNLLQHLEQMANHMASRSRSRGGNRREQPVQQAQQAVVQQAGVQVQHVDTTRLVVGGLPPSRRLRGCMSRAVSRLTLAVNPPQTGARIVENGESEDGEIDEMVVDPDQPPEEQPDVQSLWQMVQRLESNVEYLDRWSWHTWHECMKLRSRSQCMLTSPGGGHAHICNARDFHVEDGEIDEMVVDPNQPPEEQPDVHSLWQTVQRLESNVEYLDRWSWHTWHECMKLRSRSQCMLTSPGGGHAHICNARDFHVEEAPQRPDLFGEETVQPFDQTSIFLQPSHCDQMSGLCRCSAICSSHCLCCSMPHCARVYFSRPIP